MIQPQEPCRTWAQIQRDSCLPESFRCKKSPTHNSTYSYLLKSIFGPPRVYCWSLKTYQYQSWSNMFVLWLYSKFQGFFRNEKGNSLGLGLDAIYDSSTAIQLQVSLDFQVCTVGVSRNANILVQYSQCSYTIIYLK